jgi:AcrR family transcriptional regulator
LRNALVRAGLALLEDKGAEALTLRAIATAAGVSHAAPAHHFGNLRGLLTALAAEGFERFAAAMESERAAGDADPRAQVYAAGRAYVGFARTHPALFRLMFSSKRLDPGDPAIQAASERAYRQLKEIVAGLGAAMKIEDPAARAQLELIVWSFAHGFAHLTLDVLSPQAHEAPFGEMPDFTRFLARPPATWEA